MRWGGVASSARRANPWVLLRVVVVVMAQLSVGRRGGASNTQGYINGVARSHARALELRADPALRGEAEQRIASRASSSCKTAERLYANLKATGAQVRAFRPAAVALMSESERADVREKDLASRDERIRESMLGNLRVVEGWARSTLGRDDIRLVEPPEGGEFEAVPQGVMESFVKSVGLGHVEQGGYFDGDDAPHWHVPYGKYAPGGGLKGYTPGWLQRALWAVELHHRVHSLVSPVWEGRSAAGMKCFDEYARAQQLLAEYARLHVATAMVDEKWKKIRPLLEMENRRDLRFLALSCHWNALGSRSAELFWTDLRGAWRCAGPDGRVARRGSSFVFVFCGCDRDGGVVRELQSWGQELVVCCVRWPRRRGGQRRRRRRHAAVEQDAGGEAGQEAEPLALGKTPLRG